jgi:gliding motility-associated-like protein
VYPLPVVWIEPKKPIVCIGSSLQLSAVGSGNQFHWSGAQGLSAGGSSISVNPVNSTNYTVVATANNCTNAAVTTVSVVSLPTLSLKIEPAQVCLNSNVKLSGTGGKFFTWRGPSGIAYSGQEIDLYINQRQMGGSYLLTVTDTNGCSASGSTSLTVLNPPSGFVKGLQQGCAPFCSKLSFESESGLVNSEWILQNKIKPGQDFNECFSEPGNYGIQLKLSGLDGCSDSRQFTISVLPKPEALFTSQPQDPVEEIDEVNFTAQGKASEFSSVEWFYTDDKNFSQQAQSFSHIFSKAGIYPVVLVVGNHWGCRDTALSVVRVKEHDAFYMPNVFTPNADGRNDLLLPVLNAAKKYHLDIFSRWDEIVFSSNDPATGWDGTYRGEECPQNVYIWKISLSNSEGQAKTYTGTVMLIR